MLSLLFTTSDKPLSRLTRWGLETDCSHFAVGFDIHRPSGIIFHSNVVGVELAFYREFQKNNRIIHALGTYGLSLEDEEKVYLAIVSKAYGGSYDYGAWAFWALNILGNKLFNLDVSKKNLWNSKNSYLCTEIYQGLSGLHVSDHVTFPRIDNTSMIKPHEIYEVLRACPFVYKSFP